MEEEHNQISRRTFLTSAAAVTAAAAVSPTWAVTSTEQKGTTQKRDSIATKTAAGKPNSRFNGVQIGTITYSFRDIQGGSDATIKACLEAGVSSIELMGDGLEEELGAPSDPVRKKMMEQMRKMMEERQKAAAAGQAAPAGPGAGGPPRFEMTDEDKAAQKKYQEDLADFRKSSGLMAKWAALAKKFKDAGIDIHILKWIAGDTEELYDYTCNVVKTFGAKAFCTEGAEDACKKYGAVAAAHGLLVTYHNHAQYSKMTVDEIQKWLDYSPANRLNFDSGHYFGFGYDNSTKLTPIQFIDHFHDRIFSIHMKDKTKLTNQFASNQNQVWGQGETPVREILQHVRDHYPHLYCDIELEYNIPKWTTSAKEVGTCVRYAREALIY